jgi:hypothetical protein
MTSEMDILWINSRPVDEELDLYFAPFDHYTLLTLEELWLLRLSCRIILKLSWF